MIMIMMMMMMIMHMSGNEMIVLPTTDTIGALVWRNASVKMYREPTPIAEVEMTASFWLRKGRHMTSSEKRGDSVSAVLFVAPYVHGVYNFETRGMIVGNTPFCRKPSTAITA